MTIVSEKKIQCFTFFPYKIIRDQIWPWGQIDQNQPRVLSWTNFVVLEHPMLHAKFQGHRPFGFGEEDFYGFYHKWAWRPSWSCDQDRLNKLSFPYPMETPYEIWLESSKWFLRRRRLKSVDDRQTDRRTDGRRRPTYPITPPMSLRLTWAKELDFNHLVLWES